MATQTGDRTERWLSIFEEYVPCEEGTVQHDVALILKDMLLSADPINGPRATALQLNTYYWKRNDENRSYFEYSKKAEPTHFISLILDLIVRSAILIPYDDVRQEMLVKLALELRNLPPNPVKAWNGDRLLPPHEEAELGQALHET